MATVKVKFCPPALAGCQGTVYYQVIHDRRVRRIASGCLLKASEWRGGCAAVAEVSERIRCDLQRLSAIVGRLDARGWSYSADDVVAEFERYRRECSLSAFMESVIASLACDGKVRTAETYRSALSSFGRFLRDARGANAADFMLDSITPELLKAYERWLHAAGLVPNTVSFYNRILRAVYNRAAERGIIENRHPFGRVYTGVDKTAKRALPLPVLRRIKALDLSRTPALEYSRDMFMLSFYLRGMSFIDMAFLRKSDLCDGYVAYRRRKTGRRLVIRWTQEMQAIVDKYPENASCYLLPVIRSRGTNERCRYRNVGYNINHNLKKIAAMVGVAAPLTLYVARHSWASAAQAKGVPVGVISEGMGHTSEATTRIYLSSLDSSVVDSANSLIMSSL